MIEKHKQCHEKLSFALLGYRTTVRTLTRETPYMLVYSTEAVIPAEVEIPSLRIIQKAELDNAEWVESRYEKLALIYGKRMNAVCHDQLYQNRMSRAFNKRVKPRQFIPGQLVLKKIIPHHEKAKGKFSPNWQGPYMVHRVLTGGALILAEMDGEVWPKPINSNAVKRYYAKVANITELYMQKREEREEEAKQREEEDRRREEEERQREEEMGRKDEALRLVTSDIESLNS
ncbi:uncharacterized protein [Nicotiana sylvestris]|uniref:uncharacterized protein n=1 Tax=Nicotiana sylvestris TaxID=4096 RepID=UPI00388C909A